MTQDDPRAEAVARYMAWMAKRPGLDTRIKPEDISFADVGYYMEDARAALAAADAAAWRPIEEVPDNEEVLVARHDPDGSEWYATAMWWVDRFAFFAGDPRQSRDPILLCFEPTHFRYLTPPEGGA